LLAAAASPRAAAKRPFETARQPDLAPNSNNLMSASQPPVTMHAYAQLFSSLQSLRADLTADLARRGGKPKPKPQTLPAAAAAAAAAFACTDLAGQAPGRVKAPTPKPVPRPADLARSQDKSVPAINPESRRMVEKQRQAQSSAAAWQECTSKEGYVFYHNAKTGATQWERPQTFAPPPNAATPDLGRREYSLDQAKRALLPASAGGA
jgi:hypothetical protein